MLVASLLLLLLPAPAEAGKKVRLAYKAHPGESVDWQVSIAGDGSIYTRAMGRAQEAPLAFDIRVGYQLTDLDPDGDRIVQQALLTLVEGTVPNPAGGSRSIRVTVDGMTLDGQDLGPPPFAEAFREPFATLRYTPSAVTLDSVAHESVALGGGQQDQIITLVQPALPEGKVKVGASWTGRRAMPVSIQLENGLEDDITYTLTGVDGGIATIGITGTYTANPGDVATASNGMKLLVDDLTYTLAGEAHFDVRKGVLLDSEVSLHIRFVGHTPDGALEMSADVPSRYGATSTR